MLEFVDLATARDATGVRIVTPKGIPSPWAQAALGLFRVAGISVKAVRGGRDTPEVTAWSRIDNYPAVLHGTEPVRSTWSAIVALAARLAPGVLLPEDPAGRAAAMGTLEMIAGEDGLGWNARIIMIDTGLRTSGERGFPAKIAAYLATRYGHREGAVEGLRDRVRAQIERLAGELQAAGGAYFGGARPNALDVYSATFLSPLAHLTEADCPGILPIIVRAFGSAADELGDLIPAALAEHRFRVLREHLGFPIAV